MTYSSEDTIEWFVCVKKSWYYVQQLLMAQVFKVVPRPPRGATLNTDFWIFIAATIEKVSRWDKCSRIRHLFLYKSIF